MRFAEVAPGWDEFPSVAHREVEVDIRPVIEKGTATEAGSGAFDSDSTWSGLPLQDAEATISTPATSPPRPTAWDRPAPDA